MRLSLVGSVRSCAKRAAMVVFALCAVFASGGAWAALQPSADDYSVLVDALAQTEDGGVVELAAGTFTLTNQITLARGVTIRGASRNGTVVDCANKCRAFVLSVAGATVADLTVYRGKSSESGGGIYLSNGLVTNCWIKSCVTTVLSGSGGGGGIYMTGGAVDDCEITGCSFSAIYSQGNAICLRGGTVSRCDIHGNDGGYDHTSADYGSHAVYVYGGTLKSSRIHHNITWLAGVKQAGGTVVNCLVYGNKTKYTPNYKPLSAAGVYKTNGTMLYCTVYGNVNDNETTGCSGVRQTGGTTQYCVSVGNGPSGATRGSNYVTGGTFAGNVVDKALTSYADNRTGDPDFVAADLADFRMAHPASPAVGYGSPADAALDDFNGNVRSATAPTAGAYEHFNVLVRVPELAYAYANGAKQVADVPACADYEVLENNGGIEPGFYPVRLGLTTSGATWRDGSTTNKTVQFEIVAQTVLQPTNTYEDIVAAMAKVHDGETIRFAPGTYTLANMIALSRPITLKGDSRDGVILDFGNKCRGFELSHADACLRDVTIYRGYVTGHGGGVYLTSGTVSNCLVKACTAHGGNSGGGVYMTGGKVQDCEVTQCKFDSIYARGNAIWMNGGTVSGCDIHHNDGGYDHSSLYGDTIVYMNGGIVEMSKIHHNTKSVLPGVYLAAGTMRNCLVYGNSGDYIAGGVYQTGGTLLYTTVCGNVIKNDTSGISGIRMTGGTAKHCISAENGPSESVCGSNYVTGGTFMSNVVDKVLASYSDNVIGDPDFVSVTDGDFRIASKTSPAVGYGLPLASVSADFFGNVRSLTAPTAGACEFTGVIVRVPEIAFAYANGEKQVADVPACEDYEVLENEGGTEPGFYPVVLGLTTEGAAWTDGSTANKTLQFQIVASTVLQPTNTYADIAAAIAKVNDGETIFFAPGTYTVTNAIKVSRPIILNGTRRDGVILDFGNKCRGFELSHADACLRDVTIYRGYVTGHGGGVYLTSGTVSNCLIKACTAHGMSNSGGGVYMTGGKVLDSEITQCKFDSIYARGNAIWMNGGTVSGCDIHHNDGGYDHSGLYGDTIVYMNGGVVETSKIHHNTKSVLPGVWLNAGTMRNCLVYGNSGDYIAGGVYQTGGTLLYTTVSDNVIKNDTTGISGILRTGGTTRNSIFYGNGPSGGTAGSCKVSGTAFYTNVIDKALTDYPNNRVADPLFYGVSSNDYRLSSRASAAYAYATPLATVPADIVGFPRDEETPSCGAYEYDRSQEKFGADIKIVQADYRVGTTARVEAIVSGAELEDVDIAWYLDAALLEDETSDVLELESLSLGRHTLKVVVTKKAGGAPVEKEVKDALAVRPLTCYVNTWGDGTYPFGTPETATNSINAAVAAVWTEAAVTSVVHVAAGAYTNTATVTVQDKIRILGAGRDETFVVNKSALAFSIANAAAELCDLTVRDSHNGISVSAGKVHDFRLKSNYRYIDTGQASGLTVSGSGRAWNGEIDDCSISGTYAGGGGLSLSGGVVSNVVIRRCYGTYYKSYGSSGGAVCLTGGTLTHSVMAGMTQDSSQGLAVYATGGTLNSCVITGNTCTAGGYVVSLQNVTARNCLFALNTQKGAGFPSVSLVGGSFVNCTFATNAAPKVTLNASGIAARNTIFAEMGGTNILSGTFNYCCAPSLENGVNGNISAAPRFKAPGRANCRLLRSSPGVDAGDNAAWASYADPRDLDGNPRIYRRDPVGVVDMGCYENQQRGLTVIVK